MDSAFGGLALVDRGRGGFSSVGEGFRSFGWVNLAVGRISLTAGFPSRKTASALRGERAAELWERLCLEELEDEVFMHVGPTGATPA